MKDIDVPEKGKVSVESAPEPFASWVVLMSVRLGELLEVEAVCQLESYWICEDVSSKNSVGFPFGMVEVLYRI